MSSQNDEIGSAVISTRTGGAVDDPYFVGSNEQTGQSIVSKNLIGTENYSTWKRSMELALSARSKLSFVLGKYPKPDDMYLQLKWQRCNDIIMSWILSSVSEEIVGEIIRAEDVMTAWETLSISYAGTNLARKSNLKKELSNLVQGNMSVTEYYQKLTSLWQELDSVRLTKCLVGKHCQCCKSYELEKLEDRVSQFLMGLNEEFASVRTNVNAMKEVSSLSAVYGLALQEETARKSSKTVIVQSALYGHNVQSDKGQNYQNEGMMNQNGQYRRDQNFQSRFRDNSRGGYGRGRFQKPFCVHCQMAGHTKESCFKLNGYPSNSRYQNNRFGNNRNRSSANFAVNEAETDKDSSEISLSDHQLKQIVNMLKTEKKEKAENCAFMAGMAQSQYNITDKYTWLLDSGASSHFVSNADLIEDITSIKGKCTVKLPNGSSMNVKYKGKAQLGNGLILQDVLLIPEFTVNLISVSKLIVDTKCQVIFTQTEFMIQDQHLKTVLLTGKTENGLYTLKTIEGRMESHEAYVTEVNQLDTSVELWHRRLGHPSSEVLGKLLKENVKNIKCNGNNFICTVCPLAKQTKLPFQMRTQNARAVFDLIHLDICGPFQISTVNEAKYFLTIVDDYSRIVWAFLMKQKSDATEIIMNFFHMTNTQFAKRIKIVRSDNGQEFLCYKLQTFLKGNGCLHQTSCPYTPQQNGVVERKHRHIMNTARALMFHSGLPKTFWGDSVLTAVHIINRLPTPVLDGRTPWELMFSEKPDVQHLRVFGCLCFVNNTDPSK